MMQILRFVHYFNRHSLIT